MAYTITFDEDAKGWTSFHSYLPDWMGSLNNRFYSIKDGQLYEQNDTTNDLRNNFYGVQFSSVLEFIVNKGPSEIKFMKAVRTESNKAFDVVIASFMSDEFIDVTSTTISVSEFLNKEGFWHAYVRRSELTSDLTSKASYGVGRVDSVSVSTITMQTPFSTSLISVGDELFDSTSLLIGNITDYNASLGTIEVDTIPVIVADTFLYGQKVGRIEGSEIRGYNFKVTLTDSTTDRLELFAFNSQVAKSFPS